MTTIARDGTFLNRIWPTTFCGKSNRKIIFVLKKGNTCLSSVASAVFAIGPLLASKYCLYEDVGVEGELEQNYLSFTFDPWYEFGIADKSAYKTVLMSHSSAQKL